VTVAVGPERRIAMAVGLTESTPTAVRRALDTTAVVVAVDPKDGPSAVLAAAAVVSMAARVVGHVLVGPVALPQPNPWRARSLRGVAASSRPRPGRTRRSGRRPAIERRLTVQVGANGGRAGDAPGFTAVRAAAGGDGADGHVDVYAGGDDWTAVVSRRRPLHVGRCVAGGCGLHAAAALAFGEVLKDLLAPLGMRTVPIDDELVWNLVDGRLAAAPSVRLHPSRPRLPAPQVALLGAGSVGSSAAAILSATGLGGAVDVVDPDRFDPVRNALRCPAVPSAERAGKAMWAARLLADGGWSARPHGRTVAEWAAARPGPGYPGIAVVSVDDVDGRRDAADLTAATSLSAGVAGMALHVQRHLPTDELACPYCDLVDARRWTDQAVTYARLGISLPRLQALLEGAPLAPEDVTTAVWTGAVDPAAVRDLPGKRLMDLVRRHYATAEVRPHPSLADPARSRHPSVTANGNGNGHANGNGHGHGHGHPPRPRAASGDDGPGERVPAPHVSWMAGTLLAVEVVKAALGLPGLDRRVDLDLSGVPLGGWRQPPRDPSGRCPCTTPARRQVARSLYGR
jgi:hypothetical protein